MILFVAPTPAFLPTFLEKDSQFAPGIPIFLEDSDTTWQNQKYQKLYDRFARFYDSAIGLFALLKSGGLEKRRREHLDELEIKDGARVLEVSVGTGMNLRFLPGTARYFGLDISWGMLKRCQRNLRRWGIDAFLVQGAAEHLRLSMVRSMLFCTWEGSTFSTTRHRPCERWSEWRSLEPSSS